MSPGLVLVQFYLYAMCVHTNTQATVVLDSCDFKTVVKSPSFVDKSLFIKTLTEANRCSIITAPPKFGKSLNIDMVKTFFEVEVDPRGVQRVALNSSDLPSETANYKLFSNHALGIMKHQEFVAREFGKTPVITVSLKVPLNASVACLYDAVKLCKQAVHRSFKQHEYLGRSTKVTEDHAQYVKLWCDQHSYKTMIDTLYVSHGLQALAQYLHMHFGRKVLVLVGDHDHLLRTALRHVSLPAEIKQITEYVNGMLRDLVRHTEAFVRAVVVTGVTGNPHVDNSYQESCTRYEFLGNHEFVEFFGFSEEEVRKLHDKLNVDVTVAGSLYSGYQSRSTNRRPVYNTFSILNYLKSEEVERYYTKSEFLKYPQSILEIDSVRKDVARLLQSSTLQIVVPVNATLDDLLTIKDMLNNPKLEGRELGWSLLYVLLEWGFFAYVPQDLQSVESYNTKESTIKVPNEEIKEYLTNKISI